LSASLAARPDGAADDSATGSPAAWCLFLDVDGTLLEFAATPDAVRVPPGVRRHLPALRDLLGGALALISGRTIDNLDELFAPLHLPVAGIHGLERRDAAGEVHRFRSYEHELAGVRDELRQLVFRHAGLLLEDKGSALALHFRRAPQLASVAIHTMRAVVEGLGADFELLEGALCCEIKPARADKATAIAAFLGEQPFSGRVPVFIGDDLTDNDGFRLVQQRGGLTIAVGDRVTAERQLLNPQAVSRWLSGVLRTQDPWR
jgi:trehalose 6-phosphate phosphatase